MGVVTQRGKGERFTSERNEILAVKVHEMTQEGPSVSSQQFAAPK